MTSNVRVVYLAPTAANRVDVRMMVSAHTSMDLVIAKLGGMVNTVKKSVTMDFLVINVDWNAYV